MVLLHMLKDGLPSAFCFKFRKSKPDHQETEGFIATEDELKRLEKNVVRYRLSFVTFKSLSGDS